jgi:hypothetical protein
MCPVEIAFTSFRKTAAAKSLGSAGGHVLATLLIAVAGCSSSQTKRDSGADGDAATTFADVLADKAPADGLADSLAEAGDAQGPADCLPSCVADLRSSCRTPMVGQGTCTLDLHDADGGVTVCYSNGVRSVQEIDDAGIARHVTITHTDGVTPCYFENRPALNELDFISPAGAMIAKVVYADDGSAAVMCSAQAQTYQVSAAAMKAPGCNFLTASDCAKGKCL